MDNSVIAKSGWLLKRDSNSCEWHKNWVELYRDGVLKYYECDHSPNAEDSIFMPRECILVKTGSQVEGVKPPNNHSHQCLFSVSSNVGNKIWYFCGQSLDEMRVWQLALEQSRLILSPRHQSQRSSHSYIGSQTPYLSYISSHSSAFMPSLTSGSVSAVSPLIYSSCEPLRSDLSSYMTTRAHTYPYPYNNLHNYQTNRSILPHSHPYHNMRGITDISLQTGVSLNGMIWSQTRTPFWW